MKPGTDKKDSRRAPAVITNPQVLFLFNCWKMLKPNRIDISKLTDIGGFQLEFVSLSRVVDHMTCHKFECSHWLKLQHTDQRANLVKDFFVKKNFHQ